MSVGGGALSRKFMAMRSQGQAITQGFTATGFNRNSLEVYLKTVIVALTDRLWLHDCLCPIFG